MANSKQNNSKVKNSNSSSSAGNGNKAAVKNAGRGGTSSERKCGGLVPFIVLVASLLIGTCVMFPDKTGAIGRLLNKLFYGLFGPFGAFLLPVSVAVLAFFYKKLYANGVSGRKSVLAFISILSLCSAVQLISVGVPAAVDGKNMLSVLWTNGCASVGGGVLGGLTAKLFGMLLGRVGGAVIMVLCCLVTLSFALGYTGIGIWAFIRRILGLEQPTRSSADVSKRVRPVDGTAYNGNSVVNVDISGVRAGSVSADIGGGYGGNAKNTSFDIDGGYSGNGGATYGNVQKKAENEYTAAAKDEYEEYSFDDGMEFTSYDTEVGADKPFYEENEAVTLEKELPEKIGAANTGKKSSRRFAAKATSKEEPAFEYEEPDDEFEDIENEPDFSAGENASVSRVSAKQPEPVDDGVKRWNVGDKYVYPSTDLLNPIEAQQQIPEEEINKVADKILRKLASFRVNAKLVGYSVGPSITRYELEPGEGVRVKAISQLLDDISLELAADGVRIEPHISGKSALGVEVPNKKVSIVPFRMLVENPAFKKAKSKITVCVGLEVTGAPVFMDIDDMPHVLIAGQTKSGKSVAINCMLLSLLFRVSPDEVKLILIDPKRVELNIYGKIPHLVMPVVDEPNRAAAALSWAVKEMERRYNIMEKYGARTRDEYRKKSAGDPNREDFPQMIIIIDELADLMLQVREHVEPLINRLAAKARACGMHLLIGTQRPSVDVLTGLIKANIPARISFKVAEQVDSRTILGNVGAEKLLGRGDMLIQPTGAPRMRVQGAYVDGDEITRVVEFITEKNGEPNYDQDIMAQIDEEAKVMCHIKKRGGDADDAGAEREKKKDPLFYNAVEIAVTNQSVATSSLQRFLEIGYGRAAKLIDTMERMGIVGPPNGSKPREVLMDMEQYQVWRLDQRFEDD